jgi:hypothetical protein
VDTDPAGVEGLERWAADARAREAADARVRERWLRAQAEEETSLAGVLLALAEHGHSVVVTTVVARRHQGAVIGVGVDFAALQSSAGTTTLVALSAVADVRAVEDATRGRSTTGALATGAGPGRGALGVRLADVLAQAAGQRPRISVQTGAASVVGDLRAVGSDVLTVRADGAAGVIYVGLASMSEISFLASG